MQLAQGEKIISWSNSRLSDFERCKFAAWLKYGAKIPEPERPLKPGQTEHANDRGTRIHEEIEFYVRGDSDEMPYEAALHFGPQLDLLRVLHAEGLVSLEGNWGMSRTWEIAPWESAWLRLKLDAFVHWSDTHASVIDFKSGRKMGNEFKHMEQLQLYALVTFLRFPLLEEIDAEDWYLDQPPGSGDDNVLRKTFTRSKALAFRTAYNNRGNKMTNCTDFKPNPSKHTCKWCQYGPWNGGQCQVGVR